MLEANSALLSSLRERKTLVRRVWSSVRQASWPESTLLSELMDCVATMGMTRDWRVRAEGFFVSGGVVLSDGRETVVLVAEEHGRAEVAVGVGLDLRRATEKGLQPGVFQEDADGAGQGRACAGPAC